jgi:hypothetical protein
MTLLANQNVLFGQVDEFWNPMKHELKMFQLFSQLVMNWTTVHVITLNLLTLPYVYRHFGEEIYVLKTWKTIILNLYGLKNGFILNFL